MFKKQKLLHLSGNNNKWERENEMISLFYFIFPFKCRKVFLPTMFKALSVVSSREAAKHPSSVDPPSHIPANAAMLLQSGSDMEDK